VKRIAPLTALLVLAPGLASADPGDACVTSYEGAQRARREGALVRSKADLRLCLGACPTELAKDCSAWLDDVDRRIARLTLHARGAGGEPVANLRVLVDGVERPAGEALEVDPGARVIRIEASSHRARTMTIDLAEGQGLAKTVSLERESSPSGGAPSLVGPVTLGGVGLAALTAAAALAIVGHLDVSDMRGEQGCAPACPQSLVDQVRDLWTAGAVLAGAGGGAVVGASIWLGIELSPSGPPAPGSMGNAGSFTVRVGAPF
jgi:hypothetical protein